MICAIVSPEVANEFQHYKKGVHQVMFLELLDGSFAAPIAMVTIMPEAFPRFTERFVAEDEFKRNELKL